MSHYFTNDEIKSDEKKINVKIGNTDLIFYTDNGVFSKKGLDFGTRTLLENIDVSKIKGDVLDFGCGWGAIGIYLKKNTNANIDMVDVNERALKLAKKNADLNNVNINIYQSDIYSNIQKKYDYIITNPPIRVGKQILYNILFSSISHLKKGGEMYFVVNKNQGAKSIIKDIGKTALITLVKKNKGFYVLKVQNR